MKHFLPLVNLAYLAIFLFLTLLVSLFLFQQKTEPIPKKFSLTSPFWQGGEWKIKGTQIHKENSLQIEGTLEIKNRIFEKFADEDDKLLLLLTVERFFDENGTANAINNEYFSTVLTTGGKPIEFSENKFGIAASCNQKEINEGDVLQYISTPLESQKFLSIEKLKEKGEIHFSFHEEVSKNMPNGIYRPRVSLYYIPKDTPQEQKCIPEYALSLIEQTLFPKQDIALQKADP